MAGMKAIGPVILLVACILNITLPGTEREDEKGHADGNLQATMLRDRCFNVDCSL
jgi:hypothetical protein